MKLEDKYMAVTAIAAGVGAWVHFKKRKDATKKSTKTSRPSSSNPPNLHLVANREQAVALSGIGSKPLVFVGLPSSAWSTYLPIVRSHADANTQVEFVLIEKGLLEESTAQMGNPQSIAFGVVAPSQGGTTIRFDRFAQGTAPVMVGVMIQQAANDARGIGSQPNT